MRLLLQLILCRATTIGNIAKLRGVHSIAEATLGIVDIATTPLLLLGELRILLHHLLLMVSHLHVLLHGWHSWLHGEVILVTRASKIVVVHVVWTLHVEPHIVKLVEMRSHSN